MDLSNRLLAICKMCDKGQVAADVGCDHGYVAIYLLKNHIYNHVIAMDINKGPLERAKDNSVKNNIVNIDFRLSDGLNKIKADEADTIIIAGMGGKLITRIIENDLDKIQNSTLILSPHSEADELRLCLVNNGFNIINEDFIFEDNKYYPVIKSVKSKEDNKLSDLEVLFGPVLLNNKNVTLKSYLQKEKEKHTQILMNLSLNNSNSANKRKIELEGQLELIDKALELYD